MLVDRIDALVLTGGSAFGLDCVGGVMDYLEEKGMGFEVGVTRVPIVAAAVLCDLAIGDFRRRPDRKMGYAACLHASTAPPAQGSVGAGTGATVGKLLGLNNAMKGGIGTSCLNGRKGLVVGALFAVNAFGDVVNPYERKVIAGLRDSETGKLIGTVSAMKAGRRPSSFTDQGTVIGLVATNAKLSKAEVERVASIAHNGIGQVISPAHTLVDGDTIVAVATQQVEGDAALVSALAVEATAQAIISGVLEAVSLGGITSCKEI
jgi:L-aminopeptidase/D-esterase-like protein